MDYLSVKEIAKKWKIGERSVQNYCVNGRIPGAKCIGKQWLIPGDAQPPIDRRTKGSRNVAESYCYHFPVFIYSPYYARTSELSDAERILLEAQKDHLRGKYADSISACKKMLSDPLPTFLKAGIYTTIGFGALLLGFYPELEYAIKRLKEYAEEERDHREDYCLLYAALKYHADLDVSSVYAIDPERLSLDAITFYKYILFMTATLVGKEDSRVVLQYTVANCKIAQQEGIVPAAYVFHSGIALFPTPVKDAALKKKHMDAAVKIALENKWLPSLAKVYVVDPACVEKSLAPHGNRAVEELKEWRDATLRNWKMMHKRATGEKLYSSLTIEQGQLLLLVSHGLSYQQIADIADIPYYEVKKDIQQLYEQLHMNSKQELAQFGRKVFANDSSEMIPGEKPKTES